MINELWSILVASSSIPQYLHYFSSLKKAIFAKGHVHLKMTIRKKDSNGNSSSPTQAFGQA